MDTGAASGSDTTDPTGHELSAPDSDGEQPTLADVVEGEGVDQEGEGVEKEGEGEEEEEEPEEVTPKKKKIETKAQKPLVPGQEKTKEKGG